MTSEDTFSDVIAFIRDTGSKLNNDPAETRALRVIQGKANRLQYLDNHPQRRFCWFFLNVFLEDVFYNLSGDIPYVSNVDNARIEFLKALGSNLMKFSESLNDQNFHGCFATFEEMVGSYLDTINGINSLTHEYNNGSKREANNRVAF
ncbi:MAG: hypothetical protein ABSA51_03030 [Anaerolineaceae bacterium]|jgi:hypothetical protein